MLRPNRPAERGRNSKHKHEPYEAAPSNSPARDDFYNFQPVTRVEPPLGKFRRRNRLAVVLHDDAARQKFLRDQKFLYRARQLRLDRLSVGGDK